jgi:hypothetical protein
VRRATPTGRSSGSSSTSAPQQSRTRPPRRRQLAASPVHGTYAPGNVVLRPEILRAGQRVLAAADPRGRLRTCSMAAAARAGKSPRRPVTYGVVKVNVDTDNQYAFTRPVAATARPLAGRAQGGRRDRRQAQLRPLSVGPGPGRRRLASASGKPASNSDPPAAPSPPASDRDATPLIDLD